MRLSFKNKIIIGASVLILCFVVQKILRIKESAQNVLATERARLIEQNRVTFEKKFLTPYLTKNISILQNTSETRDFTRFKDSYFATTGGGLVQFSVEGNIVRHFTVADGLPESDLTCLAVFRDKLFIGTRTKNLVTFDGEKFENYVWTERKAQAVTAFLESEGRLLIGTFGGGLIEFDSERFTEIKAEKTSIKAINCLFKDGASLYVGTFDSGLWIYETGVWAHFTTAEGLPSNRVVGIAAKDKNLYVATDFGLAQMLEKSFRAISNLPSVSSLILHENRLFLTKASGEIFTFDDAIKEFSDKGNLENAHLIFADENLLLLSNQGISTIDGAKIKAFGEAENESLTDNFVSALAFDKSENLWIGTFRRGIDVFSAEGKKLKHLESENAREINFLQSTGETVSAATSSGLLSFKNDFSVENLTKKDGLPTNSITHFSGDFIATTKGLAFRENGKIRVLSTVQNLPNNSVYTTLQIGKKLYAGTLGGLAEIEANRITRAFKDSNSNLKTNWVTALCFANERIFIGTYGGGVFELLPSGEIRPFDGEAGKFTVNPNAIFSDGERLYIGTLAGVKILDLRTQEWKTLKRILPAETVMSIAGDAENIYFGTTGGIARIAKDYFVKGETE
ncbi:MAG: two-component regulator propeller domain-containing protein [Pyrinomonadaceae bacterium]